MPPDPAEVREWVDKARADLRVATLLLEQDDRVLDACGFHAQQALEKALKAFLTGHDREFQRTHDLLYLLTLCKEIEPALKEFEEGLKAVDPYAVTQRYPGAFLADRQARAHSVQTATRVVAFVESWLEGREP